MHIVGPTMNSPLIGEGHSKYYIDDAGYPKIKTDAYQEEFKEEMLDEFDPFQVKLLILYKRVLVSSRRIQFYDLRHAK